MKRILAQGYVKKLASSGTDITLIETIKDLHPEFKNSTHPITRMFTDDLTDAFEHYTMTFKLKLPTVKIRQFYAWYKSSKVSELPEYELFGFIPSNFNLEVYTKVRNFYTTIFNFVRKLHAEGVPPAQLEYITPMGSFSTIYWTTNLNDLMLFINHNLRSEFPEDKEIAQALLDYLKEEFPTTESAFIKHKFFD